MWDLLPGIYNLRPDALAARYSRLVVLGSLHTRRSPVVGERTCQLAGRVPYALDALKVDDGGEVFAGDGCQQCVCETVGVATGPTGSEQQRDVTAPEAVRTDPVPGAGIAGTPISAYPGAANALTASFPTPLP